MGKFLDEGGEFVTCENCPRVSATSNCLIVFNVLPKYRVLIFRISFLIVKVPYVEDYSRMFTLGIFQFDFETLNSLCVYGGYLLFLVKIQILG